MFLEHLKPVELQPPLVVGQLEKELQLKPIIHEEVILLPTKVIIRYELLTKMELDVNQRERFKLKMETVLLGIKQS